MPGPKKGENWIAISTGGVIQGKVTKVNGDLVTIGGVEARAFRRAGGKAAPARKPAKKKAKKKPVRKKRPAKKARPKPVVAAAVAAPPARPRKKAKKKRATKTKLGRAVKCPPPWPKPGRSRDDGPEVMWAKGQLSCGFRGTSKAETKRLWRAKFENMLARGEVPGGWPRPYEPGAPVPSDKLLWKPSLSQGASIAAAKKAKARWDAIPPKKKAYRKDEKPNLDEIPIEYFGDPDLRWFAANGKIVVLFSGGKDSLAILLYTIEVAVSLGLDPRECMEIWHHAIDGRPRKHGGPAGNVWDWPVTESYCEEVARCLGIPFYLSWREGGLQGCVMRGAKGIEWRETACFELPNGKIGHEPIQCGKTSTQVRHLNVSGERAEESTNREAYSERSFHAEWDLKAGRWKGKHTSRGMHVEDWKPCHKWCEYDVWGIIYRWGIVPHPAYYLGWGRLSCMTCIFGSKDQWLTIEAIDPKRWRYFVGLERLLTERKQEDRSRPASALLKTEDARKAIRKEGRAAILRRAQEVHNSFKKRITTFESKSKGGKRLPVFLPDWTRKIPQSGPNKGVTPQPFEAALYQPELVRVALSQSYTLPVRISPAQWATALPAGAFGEDSGPS